MTRPVQVVGAAPLLIQWHHNGSAIPDATREYHVITAASYADAGDYTLTVSGHVDVPVSRTLAVSVRPPQRSESPWIVRPGSLKTLTYGVYDRGFPLTLTSGAALRRVDIFHRL